MNACRHLRIPLLTACLLTAHLVGSNSLAWADAKSIQEFMGYESRWLEFQKSDYVWTLEGRYVALSGGTMTFPHCPIPFLLSSDQTRNRGTTGVVEVTGKLDRDGTKFLFRVASLRSRPKDTDRLRNMRFGIDSEKAADWYRVADWGHARAKFYDDPELEKEALELDRQGVQTELRRAPPTDEAALTSLLQTARDKSVGEDITHQILHELFQARLTNLRRDSRSPEAFQPLLQQIGQDLPGSMQHLMPFPAELDQNYTRHPLLGYADSSAEQRQVLNRLLALQVIATQTELKLQPDGSNGFQLADQLKTAAPERLDLIQKYEQTAIASHLEHLSTMTHAQLEEFAAQLEHRDKPELALETKQKWLEAREPFFRQEGARGLADLADHWVNWMNDLPRATRLYQEAWKVNHDYAPASEWLTAHGYVLENGQWLVAENMPAVPPSALDKALREGRVEPGMTAAQVQAILGGLPTQLTRIATSRGVSEWWGYPDSGIVVRMATPRNGGEILVERIDTLTHSAPATAPADAASSPAPQSSTEASPQAASPDKTP